MKCSPIWISKKCQQPVCLLGPQSLRSLLSAIRHMQRSFSVSTLSRKMRVRRPPPLRSGLSWTPANQPQYTESSQAEQEPCATQKLASLLKYGSFNQISVTVWIFKDFHEKLKCDHSGKEKVSWIYFFWGNPAPLSCHSSELLRWLSECPEGIWQKSWQKCKTLE